MARQVGNDKTSPFAPPSPEEIADTIKKESPDVVFAPHVETSAGMILPDDCIRGIADAAHEVGALLALDRIASECVWTDMENRSGYSCNRDAKRLVFIPMRRDSNDVRARA